jgi:hypothetical protein
MKDYVDEEKPEEKVEEKGSKFEQECVRQIQQEYKLAYDYILPKRQEWLRRLKLYNNQTRDKDKVGDPILFTVFQTVFASLYDDKLAVEFEGNEEGDQETADNLTALAEHDYRVMEKAQIDYDWDWNTCFFGRALVLLSEFDREKMAPMPEVIDPLMWLRDPDAVSVNGDVRGRGGMRFGGREILLTKYEMEENPDFYNLDKLQKAKAIDDLSDEVKQGRRQAQGTQNVVNEEEALEDSSYQYTLLEWFTHKDGKKVIVTLANDRSTIVRYQEIKGEKFPIIDRALFPMAHDWDGVSIPDLIEDKQRARAKMINLGLDAAIAELHPMYLYNKRKIRNKSDLDFAFNKAVGVDGDVSGAYQPMQKVNSLSSNVQNVLNILDTAAQKAVAAPEIAQGVSPTNERTLGENQMIAASRSARMSVAAALFGISEAKFWNQWYWLYKKYFNEEIDEKVIRIRGTLASSWRTLKRDNIIAMVDPDVFVQSTRTGEAKRAREFREFSTFAQIAMQDPAANRRYILRRLGRIARLKSEEMDFIFPPTPDEILAHDENSLLEDNKFVPVNPEDDDIIHMEVHQKTNVTPAVLAHIHAHKMMMIYKKNNPQLFPEQQMLQQQKQQEELQFAGQFQPGEESTPVDSPTMM